MVSATQTQIQTPKQKKIANSSRKDLLIAVLTCVLWGVMSFSSTFAKEDSTKIETPVFDVFLPKGWTAKEIKLPNKDTTFRFFEHKESQIRVFIQHVRLEGVNDEETKKYLETPGLTSSSYVLPFVLKVAKKEGAAKPIIMFDRIDFGGKSEAGARAIVAFPGTGYFTTFHGVTIPRGKDAYMALITYRGKVDSIDKSRVHHDQINRAYEILRTVKFK